jgi:hypothetical protein
LREGLRLWLDGRNEAGCGARCRFKRQRRIRDAETILVVSLGAWFALTARPRSSHVYTIPELTKALKLNGIALEGTEVIVRASAESNPKGVVLGADVILVPERFGDERQRGGSECL